MADTQACLDKVDQLVADLGRALADRDWEALTELCAQVKPGVEPLIQGLEAGALEAEAVRTRLQELQQFLDAANDGAVQARKEAADALKGINRNSSAAKAYQNISSNRPK